MVVVDYLYRNIQYGAKTESSFVNTQALIQTSVRRCIMHLFCSLFLSNDVENF